MSNAVSSSEEDVTYLKSEVDRLKRELFKANTKIMDQSVRIDALSRLTKKEPIQIGELPANSEIGVLQTRATVRAIPTPRDAWKPGA